MPSILDYADAAAKILLVGKPGAGKTGSLAALVAAGYRLRIIDTDKGIRRLYSLLTDDVHYPYAKVIKALGIDLTSAVRFVSIDTAMKLQTVQRKQPNGNMTSENILAPLHAKA